MQFNGNPMFTLTVYFKLRFALLQNNRNMKRHKARFGYHNHPNMRHKHRQNNSGLVYCITLQSRILELHSHKFVKRQKLEQYTRPE